MDDFRSLPPVARTLTAATAIQSALCYGGVLNGYYILWIPQLLFSFRPEIWRLFTPYLLTDPKLNVVLDLFFMYTYASRLEFGSPRFSTPGSFFVYVLFVASVILLTAGFYLGAPVFTNALILSFAWTYAQDNKGSKSMFVVVELPTIYMPWARLALTFVMKGWFRTATDLTGILAAHLYDFLTRIYPTFGGGKNYIVTPAFVQRWFARPLRGGTERAYGQAYRPPNQSEGSSSGWSSSVRNVWGARGSGRRLGGY